jgi:hypothetical protein
MRHTRLVGEVLFALLALSVALPLWSVRYPPIEDLPQHLATIRVLHDYADPALHFSQFFQIQFFHTQYVAYYLLVHWLAYVFGVIWANKIVLTLALVALPYSMRFLLVSLGRDGRLGLYCLPLVWSSQLILGFLNFVAAVPLTLFGLGIAVKLNCEWTRRRAIGLALIAFVTFYMHIVPFALLALGISLLAIQRDWKKVLRALAPLVPALIAMAVWLKTTPAGLAVLAASGARRASTRVAPTYQSWAEALRDFPKWTTDVLKSDVDEKLLVVWCLLVLLLVTLRIGARREDTTPSEREIVLGAMARRLALLLPLVFVAYFVSPTSYDWIWPINARFAWLTLVFVVFVLPRPPRRTAIAIYSALGLLSLYSVVGINTAFRESQKELGDVDAAIAAIPKGQKVVGLIYERDSAYVNFSPYIHSVALYQAERGGAVMFTFADFPQSPIVFRPDNRPPRVPPRWEWLPQSVRPSPDLDWYDWVLVRGSSHPPGLESEFELVHHSPHWSVYRRASVAQ